MASIDSSAIMKSSISINERNAAFDAVKAVLIRDVPVMFQSMIKDDMVLELVDVSLIAAEKQRAKDSGKASKPTPSKG